MGGAGFPLPWAFCGDLALLSAGLGRSWGRRQTRSQKRQERFQVRRPFLPFNEGARSPAVVEPPWEPPPSPLVGRQEAGPGLGDLRRGDSPRVTSASWWGVSSQSLSSCRGAGSCVNSLRKCHEGGLSLQGRDRNPAPPGCRTPGTPGLWPPHPSCPLSPCASPGLSRPCTHTQRPYPQCPALCPPACASGSTARAPALALWGVGRRGISTSRVDARGRGDWHPHPSERSPESSPDGARLYGTLAVAWDLPGSCLENGSLHPNSPRGSQCHASEENPPNPVPELGPACRGAGPPSPTPWPPKGLCPQWASLTPEPWLASPTWLPT